MASIFFIQLLRSRSDTSNVSRAVNRNLKFQNGRSGRLKAARASQPSSALMSFHTITNTLDGVIDNDAGLWLTALGKQRISGLMAPLFEVKMLST
jgi:hypothetical protein